MTARTEAPDVAEAEETPAVQPPKVLFVGGTRYELPLPLGLARKWDALSSEMDLRVIARASSAGHGDRRFRLLRARSGPAFYAALAKAVSAQTKEFDPDVVVCQSPYEAVSCLVAWRGRRARPKLIVELHADWRTATRLYGSRARRALSLPADRAAAFALRRADGVRALSAFTARIAEEVTGRPPVASFTTYFDLESFVASPPEPLPAKPSATWIGVLQRYKDPRTLARAWRIAAPLVPEAKLAIVGRGPLAEVVTDLAGEFPDRVEVHEWLDPPAIAEILDRSTALVMSSAEGSEGVPRVIMEAFTRARPVICTSVGGIPDVVEHEGNGLLVDPGDADQLGAALIRLLGDTALAAELSDGARQSAERHRWNPEAYARSVREMIDRVLGR